MPFDNVSRSPPRRWSRHGAALGDQTFNSTPASCLPTSRPRHAPAHRHRATRCRGWRVDHGNGQSRSRGCETACGFPWSRLFGLRSRAEIDASPAERRRREHWNSLRRKTRPTSRSTVHSPSGTPAARRRYFSRSPSSNASKASSMVILFSPRFALWFLGLPAVVVCRLDCALNLQRFRRPGPNRSTATPAIRTNRQPVNAAVETIGYSTEPLEAVEQGPLPTPIASSACPTYSLNRARHVRGIGRVLLQVAFADRDGEGSPASRRARVSRLATELALQRDI